MIFPSRLAHAPAQAIPSKSLLDTASVLSHRWAWAAVALTAVLIGFAFQGSRGLFETTEGRYALTALEMVQSGNWLEPTLHGQGHWTKPPFAYWMFATGIKLFGHTVWAVRIPVALGFVLCTMAVFGLSARMWDRRTATLSGLVYATSPYPIAVAFGVNTDTFTAMWQILAAFAYWSAYRTESPRQASRWTLFLWFSLGMAFFTKGPPALLVLIPIVVFHLTLSRDEHPFTLFGIVQAVVFLATALWWYAVVILRHPDLLGYFLGYEVVGRIFSDVHHRNPQWYAPLTIYLPILLFGAGAWSWFVWRAVLESKVRTLQFWKRLRLDHGPAYFLMLWLLSSMVIFSLSRSRLPNYVLPVFPVIALIAARVVMEGHRGRAWAKTIFLIVLVSSALMVTAKGIASTSIHSRHDMGALYELCSNYDTGHALFVPLNRHPLNGLYYYVQSTIEPPSSDELGQRVLHASSRFLADNTRDRLVFIISASDTQQLLEILAGFSLVPTAITGNEEWVLMVLGRQ